jgi:predicted Zn-dependent protease
MNHVKIISFTFLIVSFLGISCSKKNDAGTVNCLGVDVFSLADDKALGLQADSQITADPKTYPLLDSVKYATSYAYIKKLRDNILNSGKVIHKNDFAWKVKIIHDDSTLNAFCTPGGYIYIYTGIIKYLDHEDQLAGVLGHEMGHADNRHSTKQMTTQVGEQAILAFLSGTSSTIAGLAAQLVGLKYSRCQESQADEYSVIYLSGTQYKCNGAADFFIKLTANGQGAQVPVFLSDHPGDASRIAAIRTKALALGCDTTYRINSADYTALKASLP